MKKATNTVTSEAARARAPSTAVLAASRVPRCGTAASETRIMPLLYSLPTASTPNTTMASRPKPTPMNETAVASNGPPSSVKSETLCRATRLIARPRATVIRKTEASDQTVERTLRIFVHSDCATAGNAAISALLSGLALVPVRAPGGRRLFGGRPGPHVVLHRGRGHLHESLLQRGLLRAQLVQGDAVRGGQVAE